jgi:hypothetical protein
VNGTIHSQSKPGSVGASRILALAFALHLIISSEAGVVVRGYDTPAYIDFERTSFIVREDQTNLVIGVVRTGEFRQSASVDFRLVEGTASAGSDYKAAGGTIYFPAGQSFKTISLSILSDGQAEPDETFELELFNPGANVVLMHNSATITIQDAPQIVATLPRLQISPAPEGGVALSWPDNGTSCVLERTERPAGGLWEPVEDEPVLYEGRRVVIQPVTNTFYTYRLRAE